MLSSIDVKFVFDSVRLGLFSSANILQIAEVALRVVFLLFLPFMIRSSDVGTDSVHLFSRQITMPNILLDWNTAFIIIKN